MFAAALLMGTVERTPNQRTWFLSGLHNSFEPQKRNTGAYYSDCQSHYVRHALFPGVGGGGWNSLNSSLMTQFLPAGKSPVTILTTACGDFDVQDSVLYRGSGTALSNKASTCKDLYVCCFLYIKYATILNPSYCPVVGRVLYEY